MIEKYLRMGMALVAIPAHEKGPRTPDWTGVKCEDVKRLTAGNVGLNHGLTGTCCLDVDNAPLFTAWWEAQGFSRDALKRILALVPLWASGRPNRFKALFRAPEGMRTLALHHHGFELRAAGGQDVLPPSIYIDPAGNEWHYRWLREPESLDKLPVLPSKLLAAAQATPPQVPISATSHSLLSAVLNVVPEGGRNTYLSHAAYAKIKNGVEGEELFNELMELNNAKCVPPLSESEVRAILRGKERAGIQPAPEVEQWKAYNELMPPYYRIHAGALQMRVKDDDGVESWEMLLAYPIAVTNVIRVPGIQEQRYIEISVMNPAETKHLVTMAQLSREFEQTLNNIGISVTGKRAGYVKNFLILSKEKLEKDRKVTDSYRQFGWQADGSFLVGNRLYRREEPPKLVHLESHAASLARHMPLRGDWNAWGNAVQPIFANDKQAFAFTMSLSAVLMHLTGERGGMFSLVGPSGQGKSTVQAAVASVFGNVEAAFSKAQDTENARIAFLSVMCNLPVQAEELTKLPPDRLAVLAYDVSEGRDKRRLDRSGGMREMAPEWHTILTSSSNTPIVEKLLDMGATPEAFRVLEMRMVLPAGAQFQKGDAMKRDLLANAGAAGHVIAQYLVDHVEGLKQSIERVKQELQATIQPPTDERIRVNMVAAAVVMAIVLKKALGLRIDARQVLDFGRKLIVAEREHKKSFDAGSADVLSAFINENAGHCIQVNDNNVIAMLVHVQPPYTMRYESQSKTLYVSLPHIRRYALANRMDWTEFQRELTTVGLLRCQRRVTLTKGATGIPPQGQTSCLEIDASSLALEFPQLQEQAA
jgi:hypothetical protein